MSDNSRAEASEGFSLLIATDPHRSYAIQPTYHARAPRLSGYPHLRDEVYMVSAFPGVEDGTASCFYDDTLDGAVAKCVAAIKEHNSKLKL